MDILSWIIFGGVVGWVASLIMKTDSQQGMIMNIVVGIAGALIGVLTINFFSKSGFSSFNFYSLFYNFIIAIFGAMIFIFILKVLRHT